MKDNQKSRGVAVIKQFRNGRLISSTLAYNLTTIVGRNYLLDSAFKAAAQVTSWFCGLVDNASFTGADEADTASSHTGWIEWTHYSESTRQEWPPDDADNGTIANTTTEMTFTCNATGTLKGLFLSSSNVKGGTSGTLWNMAELSTGTLAVLSGDVLQVSYSYSLT